MGLLKKVRSSNGSNRIPTTSSVRGAKPVQKTKTPAQPGLRPLTESDQTAQTTPRRNMADIFGFCARPVATALMGASLLLNVGCATGLKAPRLPDTPRSSYQLMQNIPAIPSGGVQLDDVKHTSTSMTAHAGHLRAGVADSLDNIIPSRVADFQPLGLLDQLQDASLTLDLPLNPGRHQIHGHTVTIKPNTSVRVQVELKDGKLVPTGKDGNGSRAVFTRPIDGPLWVNAHGIYLKQRGNQDPKIMLDLSGFFDQKLGRTHDFAPSKLTETLEASAQQSASPALFDTSKIRFRANDIRFGDGLMDLGTIKIDLSEASHLNLQGSSQSAQMTGKLRMDQLSFNQPGLHADLGGAEVDIKVVSNQLRDGSFRLQGGFEAPQLQLQKLTANRTHLEGHQDSLNLSGVTLDQAKLAVDVRVSGLLDGEPKVEETSSLFTAQIDGQVGPSVLHFDDEDGKARTSFSADNAKGEIFIGTDEFGIQAELKDAEVKLDDFQDSSPDSKLNLHHLHLSGDANIASLPGQSLKLWSQAEKLSLRIDDYSESDRDTRIDLGRTELLGSGQVWFSSPQGLRVEGDFDVKGVIDDLRMDIGTEDQRIFDLSRNSRLQGKLRTLHIPQQGDIELKATATVDFGLDQYYLNLPGVQADGAGSLKGTGDVHLKDGALNLTNANTRLKLTLEDGKVAGGDQFNLDLGKGSKLDFNFLQTRIAPDSQHLGPEIKLGANSTLDMVLDGGLLELGGRQIHFAAGSVARFNLQGVEKGKDGFPELVGSIDIDAPLDLGEPPNQLRVDDRPELVGLAGAAVHIKEVRLTQDGQFKLEDVRASFDSQANQITGINTRPSNNYRLRSLLEGHPEFKSNQDLINYFYSIGGQEWAGARAAARSYGLDLSVLAKDRSGAAQKHLPADAVKLNRDFAQQKFDIPPPSEVKPGTAARLAQIDIPPANFNPLSIGSQVKDGKLEFSVPISGTIGSWPSSVTFEEGTKLSLTVQVKDGEIDRDSFSAKVSQPGDAFLWMTLDGAYLNEDNSLCLEIDWGPDQVITGMENLPMNVDKLIQHFADTAEEAAKTKAAAIAKAKARAQRGRGQMGRYIPPSKSEAEQFTQALDLEKLQFTISKAKFEGDTLDLPIGSLKLDPNTQLSLKGDLNTTKITGRVALQNIALDVGDFAIEAGESEANVAVTVKKLADSVRVDASFSDLSMDLKAMAFIIDEGEFVHLGNGETEGEFKLSLGVPLTEQGNYEVNTEIDITHFDGDVKGARFSSSPEGQLEFGPSKLKGRFQLSRNNDIVLQGQLDQLQGGLRNETIQTAEGPITISNAHFEGSTWLEYSSEAILLLNGQLKGAAEMEAEQIKGLNVLGGAIRDVSVKDGKSLVRFDLEHFDRIEQPADGNFVIQGLRGKMGGQGKADEIRGQFDLNAGRNLRPGG